MPILEQESAASVATDGAAPALASRLASRIFALDSRPETVPMGHPSRSAATLSVVPCNSQRTMGMRYLSGRRLNSRSNSPSRSSRCCSPTAPGSGIAST